VLTLLFYSLETKQPSIGPTSSPAPDSSRKFKWSIGSAPGQYVKNGPTSPRNSSSPHPPSSAAESAKQGTVAAAVSKLNLAGNKGPTQEQPPVQRPPLRAPVRRQTAPISYKPGSSSGSSLQDAISASGGNRRAFGTSTTKSNQATNNTTSPFNVQLKPVTSSRKVTDAAVPAKTVASFPSAKLSPHSASPQPPSPRSSTTNGPITAQPVPKPKAHASDTNVRPVQRQIEKSKLFHRRPSLRSTQANSPIP